MVLSHKFIMMFTLITVATQCLGDEQANDGHMETMSTTEHPYWDEAGESEEYYDDYDESTQAPLRNLTESQEMVAGSRGFLGDFRQKFTGGPSEGQKRKRKTRYENWVKLNKTGTFIT